MTKQESSFADYKATYSDITVIIHGPILRDSAASAPDGMTLAAVRSVRKILPGAKILISTWAGSQAQGLGADQIIYSPDLVNVLPYGPKARPNNVNRQIVAMRAGLDSVDTKWTLKLRSDTVLISAGVVRLWGRYQERNPHLRVFEQRIITSALLTCHPRICFQENRFTPFLFHVNDMIQFGLTSDMRKLWGIPLMPTPDFTYFTDADLAGKIDKISNRRVPEDYIWTSALAEAGFSTNDSWADFKPSMIPLSELSIVNNFQLLDHHDMGFVCLKYPDFGFGYHLIGSPYFSHRQWLLLYRMYCDPSVPVPPSIYLAMPAIWQSPLACLNISRLFQFLKIYSRPLRYRIKAAPRKLLPWK